MSVMGAVTCLTIAAALAAAQGGERLTLTGECDPIAIPRDYPRPVTIEAEGATVRGLTITGSNVIWRGGSFVAPEGAVTGPAGYGLLIRRGSKIRISGARFGLARKAFVLDGADDVMISDNLFQGVGEDGIIASDSRKLTIMRNQFRDTIGKPTECRLPAGAVVYKLAARQCDAHRGEWTDGFHADAIQLRNGIEDALIVGNVIDGEMQGIGQMDTIGDLPIKRVRIVRNSLAVGTPHSITLGDCIDCVVVDNDVRRATDSPWRTVIRFLPGAVVCGNRVQDVQTGTEPCPGI